MRLLSGILTLLILLGLVLADIDYKQPETLDLASLDVDLNQIQWSDAFSQSRVPAQRLHELKTIISSQITEEQWRCCDNLELVSDLHEARAAWQIILEKHPQLSGIDLSLGTTSYKGGKLINQGVTLDLQESKFDRVRVLARKEGGFELSSDGAFSLGDSSFVTPKGTRVQVVGDGSFVLDKGVEFVDAEGTRIISLGGNTMVFKEAEGLRVKGFAIIRDRFENSGIVGEESGAGETSLSYGADGKYSLEDGTAAIAHGRLSAQPLEVEGRVVVYDEKFSSAIEKAVVRALERSTQKIDPTCTIDCKYLLQEFNYEEFQRDVLSGIGIPQEQLSVFLSRRSSAFSRASSSVEAEVPTSVSDAAGQGVQAGVRSIRDDPLAIDAALKAATDVALRSLVEHTTRLEFDSGDAQVVMGVSGQLRPFVTGTLGRDTLHIEQEGRGARVDATISGVRAGVYVEPSEDGVKVRQPWLRLAQGESGHIEVSVSEGIGRSVDELSRPTVTFAQVIADAGTSGKVIARGVVSTDVSAGTVGNPLKGMGENTQAFATLEITN